MNGAIFFASKYGSTKQYAEWFGEATGLPVFDVKNATADPSAYDFLILASPVLYFRLLIEKWVRLNLTMFETKPIIMVTVSGAPAGPKLAAWIGKSLPEDFISRMQHFALGGRQNPKDLSWYDWIMMKIGAKMNPDPVARKEELEGFDFIDKSSIGPVVAQVRKLQSASAAPSSFANLPSARTHYQIAGPVDGAIVVLLHGNAAPLMTWDETVGPLVDAGYRVLRYDLFGHGLSEVPTLRRYDQVMYSRQLFELLETLEINKTVSLVGTSQGGTIAAQFSVRFPDRVTGVCMLAPFVDKLERKPLALLRKPILGDVLIRLASSQKLMDQSAGFMDSRRWIAFRDRLLKVWNTSGRRVAILANLRGDALEDASETFRALAAFEKPVQLLWGDKDQSITRQSIDHLRDLIPECNYIELRDAAHLMHVEFPERINALILEFLRT